jgi:hypothetical protein
MSTLNMYGHGDKTDTKGGENKRNTRQEQIDSIYVKYFCVYQCIC